MKPFILGVEKISVIRHIACLTNSVCQIEIIFNNHFFLCSLGPLFSPIYKVFGSLPNR